MKLLSIVGARPQFIKYSAISRAIANYNIGANEKIQEVLIHTGQHYDYNMSKVFFDELKLPEPNYNFGIGSGNHGYQTGEMLKKIEDVLIEERPFCILVFGDTNSTLAGALAASKLNMPIAHIEAGLRSNNRYMPEEINRIISDQVSNVLFCPCEDALQNLLREGFISTIEDYNIYNMNQKILLNLGDVMYDTLLFAEKIKSSEEVLKKYNLSPNEYCLLTVHRADNTNDIKQFTEIMDFVEKTANESQKILFPIHPRTKAFLANKNFKYSDKFHTIEPVGYFELIHLLKNANIVFTDSGGMQKEAFWLKTKCITLRQETEWKETILNYANILYKDYYDTFLEKKTSNNNCYGEGNSAEKIINELARLFN